MAICTAFCMPCPYTALSPVSGAAKPTDTTFGVAAPVPSVFAGAVQPTSQPPSAKAPTNESERFILPPCYA